MGNNKIGTDPKANRCVRAGGLSLRGGLEGWICMLIVIVNEVVPYDVMPAGIDQPGASRNRHCGR